ncbi:hypothetical protein N7466_010951 [Penicillium verhagenii]|uniref:uncharacterized protein n=1 Tax=Penicillium verhagenii TaxID=1562060 RepID=UPI0025450CDF|nr:uncharacterized protein N7466_010951 [Penicillium verhagenii]KAJ5917397.1 hypothetical protein N7466_010951 [Penicillium verhagenii]
MSANKFVSESETDVIILGAGPSGLMVAYWMARYGIRTRIVDKRPTKVFTGHADGIRMRTLELFDSMGIYSKVENEGHLAVEPGFWVPGPEGKLIRQGPITAGQVFESPYHHMLLTQARLERFVLDSIREHSDIHVERGVLAETFEYDETPESDNEYPITVGLRHSGPEDSITIPGNLCDEEWEDLTRQRRSRRARKENIKAKYIIGCDGAHSWTRKQLDIPFEGASTEHIWGVIDVVPISNFPDIRRLGSVTSPKGTMLLIPRERKLVRFYVPVHVANDEITNGRFDRSTITPEQIKARIQAILAPYTFDFQILDWWNAYQIGQRIAPTFAKGDHAFLAGDAVHTHSPKVGLGMNVSMQDGFNIGWKVALVVAGVADPEILSTYNEERHQIAERLLEFDKAWSTQFTDEAKPPGNGVPDKTQNMMKIAVEFQDFADGVKTFYGDSVLVCKDGNEHEGPAFAANLVPGERVPSAKLRQPADATIRWSMRIMESNGPFRLVVLAGDMRVKEQKARVDDLGQYLAGFDESRPSVLTRYVSIPGRFDSLVDTLTIHSAPWTEVEFFDFPESLRPFDPIMGWGYEKIWCDDPCIWDKDCDGKGYERWGVDRVRGAMFILRPDQYIGWVGELEDVDSMTRYLDGILIQKSVSRL